MRSDPLSDLFGRNIFGGIYNQQRPPDLLGLLFQNVGSIFKLPPQNNLYPPKFTPRRGPTQTRLFTRRPSTTLIPTDGIDNDRFPLAVGKGWDGEEIASTKGLEIDGLERIQLPNSVNNVNIVDESNELPTKPEIPLRNITHITTEGNIHNGLKKKNEIGKHDGGTGIYN